MELLKVCEQNSKAIWFLWWRIFGADTSANPIHSNQDVSQLANEIYFIAVIGKHPLAITDPITKMD